MTDKRINNAIHTMYIPYGAKDNFIDTSGVQAIYRDLNSDKGIRLFLQIGQDGWNSGESKHIEVANMVANMLKIPSYITARLPNSNYVHTVIDLSK